VGNIRGLSAALDEVGPDALVMYFASGHYRQPIEFSPTALGQAASNVRRVKELARRLDPEAPADGIEPYEGRFLDALASDFSTPAALAELFGWVGEANRRLDAGERIGIGALRDMLWLLGLEQLLEADDDVPDPDAERLLAEREAARAERDFATADARRDELRERGWEVRDTPEGPRLVRAP
jgi:cysteinyl-tRNA synthetase